MKPPSTRRYLAVNGALGVLLAGGVGAAYYTVSGGSGSGAKASTSSAIVTVARGTVTESVSASGTVASTATEDVGFATSGTVKKIYVKAGQSVAKGQKLAELDPTSAEESLQEAKLSYQEAETAGTSTAAEYASYISAKNAYAQAQQTLDDTVLRAPFAGEIAELNGSVGDSESGSGNSSVSPTASSSSAATSSTSTESTPFVEMVKPHSLEIAGDFTEEDATKLKVGDAASVSFSALSGVTATARVTEIEDSPTTSNDVVEYPVTITLTDVPSEVHIGDSATATITIKTYTNVLYLPSAAVKTAGGQSTVTLVENGKNVTKVVTVGASGTQGVVILSGLTAGERVVETTTTTSSSTTTTNGLTGGGNFPGGGFRGGSGGGGNFPGGNTGGNTGGGPGGRP